MRGGDFNVQAVDKNHLPPGSWLIEGRAEQCYTNANGVTLLSMREEDGAARNAVLTERVRVSDGDEEIPLAELAGRCREGGDPRRFPEVVVALDSQGAWGVALRPYDADGCVLAWADEAKRE